MKQTKVTIILFIIVIPLLFFLLQRYFLPLDVLNNIPAFSENGWVRPHNSLLADPIYQFEPWRHFVKQELLSGRFPLWNSDNGGGVPFFANPQTAVLYPLNFLYYILPLTISLILIPLLKVLFFSCFSFLYFRQIHISKGVSFVGALICSVFSFLLLWILWPHTNVFIFFPLILYATEKIAAFSRGKYRFEALIIASYVFSIFGGHPETLFEITIAHLVYSLLRKFSISTYAILLRAIFFGFLIGSIQIIPSIEYILNSATLHTRMLAIKEALPIGSIVSNFFPFILGGPQLGYYRPMSQLVNFQEATGGYVGLLLIFLACWGIRSFRQSGFIGIWTIIAIISFLLSYQFVPWIQSRLPMFQLNANQRFVGILGFSVITLALFAIGNNGKVLLSKIVSRNAKIVFVVSGMFIGLFTVYVTLFSNLLKVHPFAPFIFWHVFIILASTLIGVCIFFFLNSKIKIYLLVFLIGIQILPVVLTYNPVVSRVNYYPDIPIIKLLKKNAPGKIIEVGNPNLPANVNLVYGIQHVMNNDAIEVLSYKKEFDSLFPEKNLWGNPDDINYSSADRLGINYVLSDYDIRLSHSQIKKPNVNNLIVLDDKNLIRVNLPRNEIPRQIRFLPAIRNRLNGCNMTFSIFDEKTSGKLWASKVSCKDFRNFMFYTIPVEYENSGFHISPYLIIASDKSRDQAISIATTEDNKPYVDFLYDEKNDSSSFRLLGKTKYVYLWKALGIAQANFNGYISQLENSNTQSVYEIEGGSNQELLIKKTYYPGWKASVDGLPAKIQSNGPFISVMVPKGRHIVRIYYSPLMLYLGALISLISVGFIALRFIRGEIARAPFKKIIRLQDIFAKRARKISQGEHALIFFISAIASIVSYAFLYRALNIQFKLPENLRVINWVSVNNYPKQQDAIIFFTGTIFVLFLSPIMWGIWIWIRKK